MGHVINIRQCCGDWKNWKKTTNFCHKMINFLLRELRFSGNMYFSYTERLLSAKVVKVLSLQRNDKKVKLLLIYHISDF